MLQIANLTEYKENDIPLLLDQVLPILNARKRLHLRYSRYADDIRLMYDENTENIVLPFEKFLTDLASGYASGKPVYTVNITRDNERSKILQQLLDVNPKDETYQKEMEILIDFITSYNDDERENHELFHDLFELRGAYEILYENEENEIVYSRLDPLQTVATWDYNIPANLTGLVRTWEEKSLEGALSRKVEITDVNGTRVYNVLNDTVVLYELNNHNWGDVPATVAEIPFAIFEPCEEVIQASEQLVQNIKNTYQYNDADCKLKIVGYRPQNEVITYNDKGEPILNPARQLEDNAMLASKTFYIESEGDVSYITKPLDSSGAESMFKMYLDLMFQLAGIPNTSDLAFNSADLNASAIDRKFYIMNMSVESSVALMKKARLRRFELIFNHINIKKGTKFDFRDVVIELPKNLPSSESEFADYLLKLQNFISNQTIVENLGFDYISEKQKMDEEATQNIQQNLENMKAISSNTTEEEVKEEKELENDKQRTDSKEVEIY